jgi:hypothetical protein
MTTTNEIMALAETCEWSAHEVERASRYGTDKTHTAAQKDYAETKAALQAAVESLVAERDAWKESAEEQVALLMKTASERDRLRKVAQQALEALDYSDIDVLMYPEGEFCTQALRKELGHE